MSSDTPPSIPPGQPLAGGTPAIPNRDDNHIKTLAILHYVFAGLSVLGLAFLFLHFFIMNSVFSNPELMEGEEMPEEVMTIMKISYLVGGLFMVLGGVANLLSGIFMGKRVNRIFSLIVAGFNCLSVPIGTTLGVFTIVVLIRPSVVDSYE